MMRYALLILFLMTTPALPQIASFTAAKSTTTKVGVYSVTFSTWAVRAENVAGPLTISRTIKTYKIYTKQLDGKSFDIGLTFSVRPSTNMWEFNIEGADNYDFGYQGPLSEKNPTQSDDGLRTCTEREVGCYTISEKSTGMMGSGKPVMVIYRPMLIDALGATSWCDMSYADGRLKVVGDKDWLKTAAYPVTLDPTIGYTDLGTMDLGIPVAFMTTTKMGCVPSNATTTNYKISMWRSNVYALNFKAAIYADNGSYYPGALVADSYSGEVAISRTSAPTQDSEWTTVTISASLTAGTTYWLSWAHNSTDGNTQGLGYNRCRNPTTNGKLVNISQSYAGFPPATHPTAGAYIYTNEYTDCVYITYTAGGGAVTVPQKPKRIFGGIIE